MAMSVASATSEVSEAGPAVDLPRASDGGSEAALQEKMRQMLLDGALSPEDAFAWSHGPEEPPFASRKVTCHHCTTENDTASGLACRACHGPLPVPREDHSKAFQDPDREDHWLGLHGLQFKGGKWKLRCDEILHSHATEDSPEQIKFVFECAWRHGTGRPPKPRVYGHTRWIVSRDLGELEALALRLNGKRIGDLKVPSFAFAEGEARCRSSGRKKMMASLKRALRGSSKASGARGEEDGEAVLGPAERVLVWLSDLVTQGLELNSFASQPEATNPLLETELASFFELQEHAVRVW